MTRACSRVERDHVVHKSCNMSLVAAAAVAAGERRERAGTRGHYTPIPRTGT